MLGFVEHLLSHSTLAWLSAFSPSAVMCTRRCQKFWANLIVKWPMRAHVCWIVLVESLIALGLTQLDHLTVKSSRHFWLLDVLICPWVILNRAENPKWGRIWLRAQFKQPVQKRQMEKTWKIQEQTNKKRSVFINKYIICSFSRRFFSPIVSCHFSSQAPYFCFLKNKGIKCDLLTLCLQYVNQHTRTNTKAAGTQVWV